MALSPMTLPRSRAAGLSRRLLLPRAVPHALALSSKIPKPLPGQVPGAEVQYGKKVAASDTAAAAGLHAMGAGRYQYIGDFWKSLNRGRVKLDIGDKPPTEEELEQQRLQDQGFNVIKNSMIYGTLFVAVGGAVGWWLTKKMIGVKDIGEFGQKMNETLPKVSGKLEDSLLGRSLIEESEHMKEAISESERLTVWRRSMRTKFNTEEGAELARKNSMMLADFRQMEREERKRRKAEREARARLDAEREKVGADAVAALMSSESAAGEAAASTSLSTEAAEAAAGAETPLAAEGTPQAPSTDGAAEKGAKLKRTRSAVPSEFGISMEMVEAKAAPETQEEIRAEIAPARLKRTSSAAPSEFGVSVQEGAPQKGEAKSEAKIDPH